MRLQRSLTSLLKSKDDIPSQSLANLRKAAENTLEDQLNTKTNMQTQVLQVY